MSSDRWGIEGPPEEAYSRVTNPERFQPVHGAAMELLDRLEREFEVRRIESCAAAAELAKVSDARPPVKLVPNDSEAAPIAVAFTHFPGLHLKFGRWRTEWLPVCGCDACDETADELIGEMNRLVESVVSGGFREAVGVPRQMGDGWQESEFRHCGGGISRSRGRVKRSLALSMTGGKTKVTLNWKPWPARSQADAPVR